MIYPTRCQIIDIEGTEVWPDVVARTPEVSRPHIGKCGLAELIDDGWTVRITLDDGSVIMGYECWWKPIEQGIEHV